LSNPHTCLQPVISTIRRQLELAQGILHSCLDDPEHLHNIPNLPPVAKHFKVTIPFTNDMDESLQFFIKGIGVSFLLGDQQLDNILTLCYLGYIIFDAVKSLHATFPPQDQFPHDLTKIKTRFAIGALQKKVQFSTQQSTQKQSCNTTQQPQGHTNDLPPCPILGIVIIKTSPYALLLFNAIHFV
jgi:hypothetical protein